MTAFVLKSDQPLETLEFFHCGFSDSGLQILKKLLTDAGVSICTQCVSGFTVTAIATVRIHAALGTRPLLQTTLVHIWSQYETLFKLYVEILAVNDAEEHR